MTGAFLLAAGLAAASGQPTLQSLNPSGEYLIRQAPNRSAAAKAATLDRLGLIDLGRIGPGGWTRVRPSGPFDLARIRREPGLLAIEPNYTLGATADIDDSAGLWTPDDPSLSVQWHLVGMPVTWHTTRGVPQVVVAVLDSGLRLGHAESPDVILPGWDFVDGDADPDDGHGHGTHMTSIIVQATDNGVSGAGVAPGVALMPVRVLGDDGLGTIADVAAGIYWATDQGADIINLSLALPPVTPLSQALHDAVVYAAERDVILIGSSGNHGAAYVSQPAAYDEVIAVGAVTRAGSRASYSNHGAALDLVAPGGEVADTDGDGIGDGIAAFAFHPSTGQGGMFLGAGTSQAAAYASGVAALLVSAGENGRDRIRTLLCRTADDPVPGWDPTTGYGIVAPGPALAARTVLATEPESNFSGQLGSQALPLPPKVGAVVRHPSGWLLVIEDATGTWAFADRGPDRIGLWRLHQDLDGFAGDGGLWSRIDAAGSVIGILEQQGQLIGDGHRPGGLATVIDPAGTTAVVLANSQATLFLVDGSGSVLGLLSSAGGIQTVIEGAGGMHVLLESSGGMMTVIESSGGMMTVIESSGGLATMLEGAGGIMTVIESSSMTRLTGLRAIDEGAPEFGGTGRARRSSRR